MSIGVVYRMLASSNTLVTGGRGGGCPTRSCASAHAQDEAQAPAAQGAPCMAIA